MVAGSVSEPRIDLRNQDLVRSHIHAVWLSAAGLSLGKTLADILTVGEGDLSLPLKDVIRDRLGDPDNPAQGEGCGNPSAGGTKPELEGAAWFRGGLARKRTADPAPKLQGRL